jgi:hypothetical protein
MPVSGLRDVQCVFFSNALAGVLSGQECIRGTALHQACVSVAAEEWDCILVVGAEKMYQAERGRVVRLMGTMDVESLDVGCFRLIGARLLMCTLDVLGGS